MTYQQRIAEIVPAEQPHIIEAWMRIEHGTLDGLSVQAFAHSARVAAECAAASTDEQNEALARSYGLRRAA